MLLSLLTLVAAAHLPAPESAAPAAVPQAAPAPVSAPISAPVSAPGAAPASPELWLVIPAEGGPLEPVVILGTGFAFQGYLPYFDLVPSVPIREFSWTFPIVGEVSVMVTTVPPVLPPGTVDLYVKKGILGNESNRLPFLVL